MSDEKMRSEFETLLQSKSLDNTQSQDAWGQWIYKETHIQAMWEGYQAALSQSEPCQCDECGKLQSEGFALYCVECIDMISVKEKAASKDCSQVLQTTNDKTNSTSAINIHCTSHEFGIVPSSGITMCLNCGLTYMLYKKQSELEVSQPVTYVRPDDDSLGEPCSVCFDRNCNGECMGGMMSNDKMREQFEVWEARRVSSFRRVGDGEYLSTMANEDWRVWQAAIRSQASQAIESSQLNDTWTSAEQKHFAEFLQRFPNESSQGIMSLGDAWKHGKAYGLSEPVQVSQLIPDSKLKEIFDGIDFSTMVTADDIFYLIAREVEKEILSPPDYEALKERYKKLEALSDSYLVLSEQYKEAYERACGTVASMHLAAMGEVVGPNRGVVEDIVDLKAEHDRLLAENEALRQRVAELEAMVDQSQSYWDDILTKGESLRTENIRLQSECDRAKWLITQIYNALPAARYWLNPDYEQEMRQIKEQDDE